MTIHSSSEILSKTIGRNTIIWQYCVVLPNAKIGNNCTINCMVFIENDVVIGDEVTIKSGVQLWDGIRIEDKVFVGPNVTFTNDLLPRSKNHDKEIKKTFVKKGASIGANATIVAGVTIGSFAMIGAGSVVTHSVLPHELWYGNPAKRYGYVCYCGNKLNNRMFCDECGKVLKI